MIPKWPTPSGKTEKGAKKTCTQKLTATATFKACRRVLRNRFNIKAAVEQCVADVLVRKYYVHNKTSDVPKTKVGSQYKIKSIKEVAGQFYHCVHFS